MVRIKQTFENGKEPSKKQPKKSHAGKQNINNLPGNSIIPNNVYLQNVIMDLEESDLEESDLNILESGNESEIESENESKIESENENESEIESESENESENESESKREVELTFEAENVLNKIVPILVENKDEKTTTYLARQEAIGEFFETMFKSKVINYTFWWKKNGANIGDHLQDMGLKQIRSAVQANKYRRIYLGKQVSKEVFTNNWNGFKDNVDWILKIIRKAEKTSVEAAILYLQTENDPIVKLAVRTQQKALKVKMNGFLDDLRENNWVDVPKSVPIKLIKFIEQVVQHSQELSELKRENFELSEDIKDLRMERAWTRNSQPPPLKRKKI
eukprot:36089_1